MTMPSTPIPGPGGWLALMRDDLDALIGDDDHGASRLFTPASGRRLDIRLLPEITSELSRPSLIIRSPMIEWDSPLMRLMRLELLLLWSLPDSRSLISAAPDPDVAGLDLAYDIYCWLGRWDQRIVRDTRLTCGVPDELLGYIDYVIEGHLEIPVSTRLAPPSPDYVVEDVVVESYYGREYDSL